ncbi:MAG: type II CAAX endopeptidase family protein [Candidatus Sulfotelmatobacter sp.]
MAEESGPGLTEKSQNQQASAGGSNPLNAANSAGPQIWGRIDRIRLFLWAGIAVIPSLALGFLLHRAGHDSSVLTVQSELPTKAITLFFVSLATWIVSRLEKRPLDDYGIPLRKAFGGRFWEGLVWGFATLSAILLLVRVTGHFQIDSVALTGSAVFWWALAWGATFLGVSLTEEFVFRGYWLFTMSRRMRFWPAALFLSVVFGAAHLGNHGENVLGIVQVVATGLLFCLMIRRTGNLWFAIGFHAAWDWAETFFYGTPDSGLLGVGRFLNSSVHGPNWLTGGSAGPEGSVFAMLILLLCALLIHFRFPKAAYPDRPA